MGIDWVSMRIKENVDLQEVNHWVETQKRAFSIWLYELEFSDKEDPTIVRNYVESSKKLLSYLNCDDYSKNIQEQFSIRVSVIAEQQIMPCEWQQEAYRTILPQQLPQQLQIWQDYIDSLRNGLYENYLKHLYLYNQSVALHENWNELVTGAKATLSRQNNWAKKDKFLQNREQIMTTAPPYFYSAPLWFYWQNHPSFHDDSIDEKIEQQIQYHLNLTRLNKTWNVTVPQNWKMSYYPLCTFTKFIAQVNDDFLISFLASVQQLCRENKGLFLDY